MDRTILTAQRAEEKGLSELLYKKLLGLTLIHPPADDLLKHLNGEMFLKSNPQAFFHVMHYLFCILDPVEFKKRFYWPITDKRSEANFRTNTVEYLKYINEKYKLQWGDIKSYLVVMPGGKKFIIFLLDVVAFIVHEQIRLRERQLGMDMETAKNTGLSLQRMQQQDEFFKVYSSEYISSVEHQIALLREKTGNLYKCFNELQKDSCIEKSKLLDKSILQELKEASRRYYNIELVNRNKEVNDLENLLCDLKIKMDKFQIKQAEMKYNKEKVCHSLRMISGSSPSPTATNDISNLDDTILNDLVTGFNCIQPMIENVFSELEQTTGSNDFIRSELQALKDQLQHTEAQITAFQMQLNSLMKKRANDRRELIPVCTKSNSWMMKYVCTPPIKLDVIERGTKIRLPLLEDQQAKMTNDTFNNNFLVPRTAHKTKPADSSFDLNNSLNKSRIIDPMQLLRTIHKSTTRVQKITTSALGAQWRERQSIFHNNLEQDSTSENTIKKDITQFKSMDFSTGKTHNSPNVNTSPYTPFNANEYTQISRAQLLETISSDSGEKNAKVFYSKQVSALSKVKDDSLNIANMSTSPSGRLDALVLVEPKLPPKLKLNDITFDGDMKLTDDQPAALEVSQISTKCILMTDTASDVLAADIMTPLCRPINDWTPPQMSVGIGDEDDIFNISDSVLKDVLM